MALHDQLGFESPLVLMKLGFDLRDRLGETIDAPFPEDLEPLIERIAEQEQPDNVLTLRRGDYSRIDDPDGPLA